MPGELPIPSTISAGNVCSFNVILLTLVLSLCSFTLLESCLLGVISCPFNVLYFFLVDDLEPFFLVVPETAFAALPADLLAELLALAATLLLRPATFFKGCLDFLLPSGRINSAAVGLIVSTASAAVSVAVLVRLDARSRTSPVMRDAWSMAPPTASLVEPSRLSSCLRLLAT